MQTPANRTRGKPGRRLFRIIRITGLAVVLCIVCAGLYLNRVGLPGFLKQRLLEQLRMRGLETEVERVRLSFRCGIVAEKVRANRVGGRPEASFSASAVELHPVCPVLARPRFALRKLVVHDGRLFCIVAPTNRPQKTIEVRDLQFQTEFKGLKRWTVRRCEADFAGIKLRLVGLLTNASAALEAEKPRVEKATAQLELNLWKLVTLLEQIRFDGAPVVHVDFGYDARKPKSLTGLLVVAIEGAETPWGALSNATMTLRINDLAGHGGEPVAKLQLQVGSAKHKWATATDTSLQINWSVAETGPEALHSDVDLSARAIVTRYAQVDQLNIAVQCEHFATNPMPTSIGGTVHLAGVKTRFGEARSAKANIELQRTLTHKQLDQRTNLVWGARFAAVTLKSRVELAGVASTNLPVETVAFNFGWSTPAIVLSNLTAQFDTGAVRGWLGVDTTTRRAEFAFDSDFDIRAVAPLLTEGTRRWLANFEWETPPKLAGYGAFALPAWTNSHSNWRMEVQPTLQVSGQIEVGPASYRGVEALWARTHFFYSNMCWHLPDLRLKRPEGNVNASIVSSDVTREMHCCVEGDVDPGALRPVLDETARRRLDLLAITQPASVKLELWGARTEKLPRGFRGHVALTNFTFRGERVTSFWTDLFFTNQLLVFSNPAAMCDGQFANAESVEVDFGTKTVRINNAGGCADPMVVARAIGPKTAQAISPYRFVQPPNVRVNGTVPFHGTIGAGLVFDVDGGPFRWWRFNLARVRGRVHWVDELVQLNVTESDCYTGKLAGAAQFDFSSHEGAQFQFNTAFTNVNVQLLMQDISTRTNRLEGLLTGQLHVHKASTLDWASWAGHGQMHLRDGYLWEVPLFSVFSPVLDAVIPGLGRSRFTDGRAQFVITNGMVRSSDLELRAPLLRMKLRGNVDFHEKVDARVEAELLRDTWLIGPLVSTALYPLAKIFEYRLTGTLTEPKAEPVYVPKLLLAPLQPMRMLKSLFTDEQNGNNGKSKQQRN